MPEVLELYAPIGVFAGVVQIACLAVAFGVGGVLSVRGRRAGEWTQWMLGLHLILSMGIGYLLTCFATVAVDYDMGLPAPVLSAVLGVGYAATNAGLVIALHFTRCVFRPGRGPALAYAVASGAAIWSGWLGYLLSGDVAHGRFEGGWYWLMTGGMFACNAWVAFEPLRYHAQLRRRVQLGLCEPIVADRMRLWGIGSVARAILGLGGPISTLFLQSTSGEAQRLLAGAAVLVTASLLGLVTAGTYWLAFEPPRAYLLWIERRAGRRRA